MIIRLSGHILALFTVAVLALVGCTTAKQAPTAAAEPAAAMEPKDSDGDGVFDDKDRCPDTVAGAKVDSKGCEVLLEIPGFHFAFDSAELLPQAQAALDSIVGRLNFYSKHRVEVAGYTDSTGPLEYNEGLSMRRAQAAADYLIQNGIDASRLAVVGYGESNPVASNDTREGRAKNRRVQINDLGAQ